MARRSLHTPTTDIDCAASPSFAISLANTARPRPADMGIDRMLDAPDGRLQQAVLGSFNPRIIALVPGHRDELQTCPLLRSEVKGNSS